MTTGKDTGRARFWDIMKAWENVSALIEQYNAGQTYASRSQESMVVIQQRLRIFLEQLEAENSAFVERVERNILNSGKLADLTILREANR